MRAGDTKRYSCFPQWRVNTGWDASPFFKRSAYVLNPRPASRPPSRPFHGIPYFASRFARTAGRTGHVIPSPLPTAHETRAVGDATRPHRVTRIDLISSFIPRIAHSSLRSERRLRRACGCAASRPTTRELLEERCRSRFWRPVHLQVAGQLCACSAPLVQNDLVDQLLPLPPVRCEREAQSWPYVK